MRVADVMKTGLATIGRDATVAEAVAVLSEAHVSGLPVVDQHRRLIGVLSTTRDSCVQGFHSNQRFRLMTMRCTSLVPS